MGQGENWWEEGQGGPTMHIGVGIQTRTPKDSIPPAYPDYVLDLSFGLFLPFLLLPHPVRSIISPKFFEGKKKKKRRQEFLFFSYSSSFLTFFSSSTLLVVSPPAPILPCGCLRLRWCGRSFGFFWPEDNFMVNVSVSPALLLHPTPTRTLFASHHPN